MSDSLALRERQIPRRALRHLDFIRGAAALAVVIGHVRGLFMVDRGQVHGGSPLLGIFYFLTGLGHQSVVVFFVLSGFFVGHSVLEATTTHRWSWSQYLLRRLCRLYVVLVPALFLTALCDLLGMHFFGATSGIYAGSLDAPQMDLAIVRNQIGALTFLGNLAFLQSFFVPTYGSNGPLWSLSYEFWCYIAFPLMVYGFTAKSGAVGRILCVAAAVGIVAMGRAEMLRYAAIWGLGAAVAGTWPRFPVWAGHRAVALLGSALGLFAVTCSIDRIKLIKSAPLADLLLGLGTTLLLSALIAVEYSPVSRATLGNRLYDWVASQLASFSYTLYLVHYPMLMLLFCLFNGTTARWEPTPRALVRCTGIILGVVVLWAYPIARLTEAHTERVRAFFAARLKLDRA